MFVKKSQRAVVALFVAVFMLAITPMVSADTLDPITAKTDFVKVNLLGDLGSFENVTDGVPEGWNYVKNENDSPVVITDTAHSGSNAVKIGKDITKGAALNLNSDVIGDIIEENGSEGVYVFSFWFKQENNGTFSLNLVLGKDSSGANVIVKTAELWPGIESYKYVETDEDGNRITENGWYKMRVEFDTTGLAKKVVSGSPQLYLSTWNAVTKKALIDDFEIYFEKNASISAYKGDAASMETKITNASADPISFYTMAVLYDADSIIQSGQIIKQYFNDVPAYESVVAPWEIDIPSYADDSWQLRIYVWDASDGTALCDVMLPLNIAE